MQNSSRNSHILANVALLYYGEGLTQNEISKRIGVSRASVVNYLREGRERGVVDIHINGQALASSSLSRDLRKKFNLTDVYIARFAKNNNALTLTAYTGAMAFLDIVQPGDHIGIAWGETIKQIADQLPHSEIKNTTVSQIIGAMYSTRLPSAEGCSIKIANRIGAEYFTLHAPAILSSAELTQTLKNEPTIKAQLERLSTLDVVLFSVGDCSNTTHLVDAEIADRADMNEARLKGAVGIVCSRFIDSNGEQVDISLNDRLISIEVPELKNTKKRVLVASGMFKLEAVKAALKGGLVTHLVLDYELATMLVSAN